MKQALIASTLFCVLLSTIGTAEGGGAQTCVGNYAGTVFSEDLVVPEGQTCQLDQFNVVYGSIRVEKGADLIVCPDNAIHGDVKSHGANSVYISDLTGWPCSEAKALGITIDGDVKVEGGGSVSLIGNPYGGVAVIKGNIKVEHVGDVSIQNFHNLSAVEGNVKVERSGTVTVTDNIIGGDLRIKGTEGSCVEQNNLVVGRRNSCP